MILSSHESLIKGSNYLKDVPVSLRLGYLEIQGTARKFRNYKVFQGDFSFE
jgi:hypothetical protein